MEFLQKLVSVRPSPRQLDWQALEFYAFIHYGVNTYTNREWGDGKENPEIFIPDKLDSDQWCRSFVDAGMKAVIITAKHHDGFCLFDSKYTKHSVMYSPYGKDIAAQLSKSCKKFNLKLGMYLSPWDRHESTYGSGKQYDDFFCNQLTEIMTNYGDLFCLWFDGACGEGPSGKKQEYDWGRYFSLVRKLQPNAVIASIGPDVRWCGNEAGICRSSEFSVVPKKMADIELIQSMSQQKEGKDFADIERERCVEDIGSRKALQGAAELVWYPAEVDYSIRPGWFYHPEEDDKVRTLESLKKVYLQSVGGNASFLLNVPPNRDGLLHENDVKVLKELGNWIKSSFSDNLLKEAAFTASSAQNGFEASGINRGTWASSEDDSAPWVEAELNTPIAPKYLILQEDITFSQRIEDFTLYYWHDNQWKTAAKNTVVGYKRICAIEGDCSSRKWRLEINACRLGATLSTFAFC